YLSLFCQRQGIIHLDAQVTTMLSSFACPNQSSEFNGYRWPACRDFQLQNRRKPWRCQGTRF
ncbi:MAG: hypothetical protein WBO14_16985, partial [Gammaproteobacteria bacterium]